MSQQEDKIKILFQRYADNVCTEEELRQLYDHLKSTENEEMYELMDQRYDNISINQNSGKVDWDYMFQQIIKRKSQPLLKRLEWRRIAAAASIVLVLSASTYFYFFNKTGKQTEIAKVSVPKDINAPETNRATIILANGQKIYLDSVQNGSIAVQGNVNVVKLSDGRITYKGVSSEIVYNTLTNPKGSKVIDMTLADGSRVWLNAGSSVTFPVAFVGSERKVSITGEAYFEVQHNADIPFKVTANEMEVTVLGTHFNVNAYNDEPSIRTTLLEGSVKVTKGSATSLLKPGQQAKLNTAGSIDIIKDVDVNEVMAWKNGLFVFDNTTLPVIMRQISRWYNVSVVYEKNPGEEKYGGGVSRQVPLSDVLKMLEANGIQCELKGDKVIVKL